MSKSLRITFIIILSLLAAGLTALFVMLIKNDSSFFIFNFFSKESKELIIDEKYENVYENIEISSEDGNIYIEHSDTNDIKVVIYGKKDNSYVKTDNNTLYIKGDTEKCSFFCFNHEYARIEVYLPQEYDKKLLIDGKTGDVKIKEFNLLTSEITTTTGDIEIEELNSLKVKTKTGDINIRKIDNADIKVTTGDIDIDEINKVEIDSTTGDINIKKINNYVQISVTTGDVSINDMELTENSSIRSTTGDVYINSSNEFYINASSSTGDIKIKNNYRTAEYELKIKTTTGDIKVEN